MEGAKKRDIRSGGNTQARSKNIQEFNYFVSELAGKKT
jgi:hypothetical protein